MGNKINNNNFQIKTGFNIQFIGEVKKGENSYLIKLIKDSKKYFDMKIKSEKTNDIIIFKYNNNIYKLNLIDKNKSEEKNNYKIDCFILEYDINDLKSFEEIKILYNEKYKKNNETNMIYLIAVKNNSEEKTKTEAINFSNKNNLKFVSISDKNENDIKSFINNLLENLERRKIQNINNNKNKNDKQATNIKDKYKVCFIGGAGIGAKTSLIKSIIDKDYDLNSMNTCLPSIPKKMIELKNNKTIELELWDTPGQEKFRALDKLLLKNSDCVVIGFDLTNKYSFDEIIFWYLMAKDVTNAKLMYLIACKTDLIDRREISENEAKNLAKEYNLRYFEISCLTKSGIQEFIKDLSSEIIKC